MRKKGPPSKERKIDTRTMAPARAREKGTPGILNAPSARVVSPALLLASFSLPSHLLLSPHFHLLQSSSRRPGISRMPVPAFVVVRSEKRERERGRVVRALASRAWKKASQHSSSRVFALLFFLLLYLAISPFSASLSLSLVRPPSPVFLLSRQLNVFHAWIVVLTRDVDLYFYTCGLPNCRIAVYKRRVADLLY